MLLGNSLFVLCFLIMGAMTGALIGIVRFIFRQRAAFIKALQHSAEQNITTAQQLANAITSLQRQQQQHEQQMQTMAQAVVRLRQDISPANKRNDSKDDKEAVISDEPPRILH